MTRKAPPAKKANPVKVRNPLVVPALKRKSGRHAPDPKGQRRLANRAARDEPATD